MIMLFLAATQTTPKPESYSANIVAALVAAIVTLLIWLLIDKYPKRRMSKREAPRVDALYEQLREMPWGHDKYAALLKQHPHRIARFAFKRRLQDFAWNFDTAYERFVHAREVREFESQFEQHYSHHIRPGTLTTTRTRQLRSAEKSQQIHRRIFSEALAFMYQLKRERR